MFLRLESPDSFDPVDKGTEAGSVGKVPVLGFGHERNHDRSEKEEGAEYADSNGKLHCGFHFSGKQ